MSYPATAPVLYAVWVNGVPYNSSTTVPWIADCQIEQSFGKHDLVHLRIEYPWIYNYTNMSIWPDDTPIAILWGRKPDTRWWYGYVNHKEIKKESDSGNKSLQITYVCIGTSAVMNADVNRRWEQVSPTYIAKKIAREHNMRAIVTPLKVPSTVNTAWILEYEVQANESDFCFLNRVANKCGLRFWCSGGTLYMVDPSVTIQGAGSSVPPVYYANKDLRFQDTCRQFEIMKGKNLPGSVYANRVLYGIDANSGKLYTAVSNPPPPSPGVVVPMGQTRTHIKTDIPVNSYQDAAHKLKAWARLSQHWVSASAQLFGTTNIYPGKLVDLEGSALPDGASGIWLVTCAEHLLRWSGTTNPSLDRYMTNVELVRNSEDAAGSKMLLRGIVPPITPETNSMHLVGQNPQPRLWAADTQEVISLDVNEY